VTPPGDPTPTSPSSYGLAAVDPPIPMVILERDFTIRWISTAAIRELKLQPAMVVGRCWYDFFPESRSRRALHEALCRGERDAVDLLRIPLSLGCGTRYFSLRLRPLLATDGSVESILGVGEDVTPQVEAERALRKSEARLAAAIGGTGIGLWEREGEKCEWGENWCERFDIEPGGGPDLLQNWIARIHPEDVERYIISDHDTVRGLTDFYAVEYRIRTHSGAWRWVHERGAVTERDANGRARRFVGVCFDIDEQKKMEAALHKAEDRYDLAINAAQLPVWEYDVATDTVTGNSYWHRAVGHELSEAEARQRKETWLSHIHPDDVARHERIYRDHSVDDNGLCQSEFRIKLPNGTNRWLLDRARVVERAADGQPLKVVGISVDIDAQKRLQAVLCESEARLETAIGGSDIGLWDWDVGCDALRWLSDWPLRKGIKETPEPSTYLQLLERIHPEDRERLDADAGAVIAGGRDAVEMDYRIQSLQGESLWIQVRAKVIERDRNGRALRIVGACLDVDARRRAEELLRTQALILATMAEGVVLFDRSGRIELTNPAFDRLFRCSAADLAGMSFATLLSAHPTGDASGLGADRLLECLRKQTDTCDIVFRRADNTEFTGEVTTRVASESGGRWLAVLWDVTERKRLEQEVLDIANSERRRFGHELHDGLCQELTGIALILRSMATNLQRDVVPTLRQLTEVVEFLNTATEDVRAMAQGLSPVTLDRGGLVPALRALVERMSAKHSIDVQLRSRVLIELPMDEATANHIYRIAQEAINNAVKHGGARAITVSLHADEDNIRLSVSDDGRGLPVDAAHRQGMGLKIMDYRARLMGGVIDVLPRRRGGTEIRCVCPVPSPRVQC
jgi:PAS domain S-box-containing protein